ncbi:MAG: hypothetical protein COY22_00485 [Candidatus Tagabacteria bacterium CG_4_10_14_0_2_um_filter_40_13]|uniref:Uncharacterized protein n=1 Tax=Candidatus Tagabacteria bacterium CG_4_9_14_0_2_um_filter_41_11 TaxID=1975019 RepID=A0A2M8ERI9_9BACT|nr:MAG: hypothetical protein COY22_00485 [Candidatus Tagabacteria bacterium CG_4_10_14_0_2_um_filter_40_13]PJC25349.1 MAG: hypothetical protein CO056_00725 [Candidatus Tagabacteria bacterium CG_4_9_14_0_2_um_filter_41_11]
MPCLIALVVLAVLSIFSLKYRILAKEAFECVFRRITLRPCQAGFDQKLKTGVSSWFLKKNERIGGFVFRRFEILSWIFVIVFSITTFYVGRGVYFYATYGSCAPQNPQNCVINQLIPAGATSSQAGFPPCEEYNATPKK